MGVDLFVEDMAALGLVPTLEGELVVYRVTPVDGALAGEPVATGIGMDELKSWPQIPPHWLHFPDSLRFGRTNSRASSKAGWSRHSRQIAGWGDAPAGVAWASHVRAVLSEVVS